MLLQRGFTATPARCWAALYGVGCLSVRAAKAVSMCLSARHLSACLFHVSVSGAIIAAATANSRRLSQQNPYKTCVSLVELDRTSRHFLVHFENIPTKTFPRYRRCAQTTPSFVPPTPPTPNRFRPWWRLWRPLICASIHLCSRAKPF